jgi:hypothetical protein
MVRCLIFYTWLSMPCTPVSMMALEAAARKWSTMLSDSKWEGRRPVHFDVCGTPFALPI